MQLHFRLLQFMWAAPYVAACHIASPNASAFHIADSCEFMLPACMLLQFRLPHAMLPAWISLHVKLSSMHLFDAC
jgi:hypothetical protein